ncbi:zinc ABC transporter substrate-binding protein [Bacillus sp. ISL-47]|uniref:metal ABC transporter solute-binding protein, Zn/Mn family n=1 Tax=Bacillus sp. ISL-47 TaxID=2819130 RepID=UPI001BEA6560|nr:zinc ABC transporter substrate-binding protein [Bacillus sp. ISL-47]MBT2689423.1 zinc ABC transporter substrate-binding protein [Bacillus sp. ISL-47]MBT2709854.1 zinc ABC transporter substrate-binding protein [Pseudomonas sp. ISL-84]
MRIKQLAATSILTCSLILAGCGSSETASEGADKENKEALKVYTTIYPLEDFTQKIGGEFVEVQSIYSPNVDAHSYEPSTNDMISLAKSDLFIYTGVGIEGFAEKASKALEKESVKILKAGEGIELIESAHDEHNHEDEENHSENEGHEGEHGHSESEDHEDEHGHSEGHEGEEAESHEHDEHIHSDKDPHVWLDPILSIDLANTIKNSLIDLMPEHKSEFEANFNQLKSDLEKLDKEIETTIDSSKTKYILVAHAAYGYWEERYGIEQIAIAGLSPTQELSQKELQAIINESSEHNLNYVIFEQNVSPKVAKIIQKEIGAKSLSLHNLEAITEENIKENDDYFSIMRKNLETLKTALNE